MILPKIAMWSMWRPLTNFHDVPSVLRPPVIHTPRSWWVKVRENVQSFIIEIGQELTSSLFFYGCWLFLWAYLSAIKERQLSAGWARPQLHRTTLLTLNITRSIAREFLTRNSRGFLVQLTNPLHQNNMLQFILKKDVKRIRARRYIYTYKNC